MLFIRYCNGDPGCTYQDIQHVNIAAHPLAATKGGKIDEGHHDGRAEPETYLSAIAIADKIKRKHPDAEILFDRNRTGYGKGPRPPKRLRHPFITVKRIPTGGSFGEI
jgi:hypothetical protein